MEFICTDPVGLSGEKSELKIWEKVKKAFAKREGIAYWHYPLFSDTLRQKRKFREPDILIIDRDLGITLIEVKGCELAEILKIKGHTWKMSRNFYAREIAPYRQALRQLSDLLTYCNYEPDLVGAVPTRILIGLPWISKKSWEQKYGSSPNTPPVLWTWFNSR